MMAELPQEFQSLDEQLMLALKAFAPPADLADRAIASLRRRQRWTISPAVAKSAAAVVAVVMLGVVGSVADSALNPVKQIAASATTGKDVNGDFSDLKVEMRTQDGPHSKESLDHYFADRAAGEKLGREQADLSAHNTYTGGTTVTAGTALNGGKLGVDGTMTDGHPNAESRKVALGKKLSDSDSDGPVAFNSPADGNDAVVPNARGDSNGRGGGGGGGRGRESPNEALKYSYQNPYPNHAAVAGGFKFNDSMNSDFAAMRDIDTKSAASARPEVKLDVRFSPQQWYMRTDEHGARAASETPAIRGTTSPRFGFENEGAAKSTDGQNALYADGHVDWKKELYAQADGPSATPAQNVQPAQVEQARKVIRSGDIQFQVDSFDSALMTVTKLVMEDGGFVASTDSAKLPNGKTRGIVSVRVPPDRLDAFVLKLRGLGDLKSQKIASQDVSKSYSDTESSLRAARAMESRLLEMIAKGQGQIKDLLAAEKELGTWREKIEQLEGTKRYYDNLISLSTLAITLEERDIKAAAGAIETEKVDAGVETDDVEKARAEVIKAIDEAKGRILTSDLKKLDAGQFAARISAEIAPESAGPVIDRLKQLGKVARLDVDRKQTNVDGSGTPVAGAHVEKKPTILSVSLYNLANVAPRLTTIATLATNDVESGYKALLAEVEKAGGRAVSSQLQRPRPDQVSATMQLEVPSASAASLEAAVKATGEVMNLQLSENPDAGNVTSAKRGFTVSIISSATVAPRETVLQQLAAKDLASAHKQLTEAASKIGGRILVSNISQGNQDNNATLFVEVPRSALAEWEKAVSGAGDSLTRQSNKSNDTQNTLDSKVRTDITMYSSDRLPPREVTNATINVGGADSTQASFVALASQLGGRVVDQNISRDPNGRNSARVVIDVPRSQGAKVLAELRSAGEIFAMSTGSNQQAPDGELSRARFDLTFAEGEALVGHDAGLWQSVKDGLSTSLRGLAWSVQLIVIGICLVAPWVLLLWGGWKILRRRNKTAPSVV